MNTIAEKIDNRELMLFRSIKSSLVDKKKHLTNVRKITELLETRFSIWKFRFGLDPVLGLLPGLGDIISAILSFYIVFVAILHKIPVLKVIRMIFNILFDLFIGAIPLIGDALDFVIKPNIKNVKILEKEIEVINKI